MVRHDQNRPQMVVCLLTSLLSRSYACWPDIAYVCIIHGCTLPEAKSRCSDVQLRRVAPSPTSALIYNLIDNASRDFVESRTFAVIVNDA
jgi:hypothetical protein